MLVPTANEEVIGLFLPTRRNRNPSLSGRQGLCDPLHTIQPINSPLTKRLLRVKTTQLSLPTSVQSHGQVKRCVLEQTTQNLMAFNNNHLTYVRSSRAWLCVSQWYLIDGWITLEVQNDLAHKPVVLV